MKNYPSVYRAVRSGGHGRWRALLCCNDVRRGSWTARDVGEMRAQLDLMARALRKAG